MLRVLETLRSRFSPRAAALALMTIGVAACSANASRSNSNSEATSISQTQTTQVSQPHRSSRLRSTLPRALPALPPRPAAAPEVTASVVREHTSSANWSPNGRPAMMVAGDETVDTVARRAEGASTEPQRGAGDFAALWPDLPYHPHLSAPELAMIDNSHPEKHEPIDAQEEMPLIWPILTESERAGLPDSARKSVLKPAILAAALAMVLLLFAGAIFKRTRTVRPHGGLHLPDDAKGASSRAIAS